MKEVMCFEKNIYILHIYILIENIGLQQNQMKRGATCPKSYIKYSRRAVTNVWLKKKKIFTNHEALFFGKYIIKLWNEY